MWSFSCILLGRFLPTYCNEHLTVRAAEDDQRKPGHSANGVYSCFMMLAFHPICMLAGMLSFPMWMLAWDAYSLAAPMDEQFSFNAGNRHKHEIAQIANDFGAKVAVTYDRLARPVRLFVYCDSLCY